MTAGIRLILATNLKRMIAVSGSEGESRSVRSWALAKGLEVRQIDRMVKGDNAVTLDTLELVATGCGIPAWQLLHPEFDPSPSVLSEATVEDVAFLKKLRKALEN